MLIFHTGDSHLDTSFYSRIDPATGLEDEWESNAAALRSAVDLAVEREADCFIHAGDAFKNGRPSAEAVMLLVDTLADLVRADIPVILADGNHETIMVPPAQRTMSVVVAEALAKISPRADVHLVDREPRLVTTKRGLQAMVLPWLSKAQVLSQTQTGNLSPEESDRLVIDTARRHLDAMSSQLDDSMPTVLAGHLTVDKVSLSSGDRGSELDFTHPFSEPIMPVDVLESYPYLYGALSHIHLARKVGRRTFYAGSPNRHTLTDADQRKSINQIVIDDHRSVSVRRLDTAARAFHRIDLEADDATDRLGAMSDRALVAFVLPTGASDLDDATKAVVSERGARVVKVVQRPRAAEGTPTVVDVLGEQIDPLEALRQRLTDQDPQSVERVLGVAQTVAQEAQR